MTSATPYAAAADNNRAALWMLLAMAGFAVEDIFLKGLAVALPPGQVLVFHGLIGGAIFTIAALVKGEKVFTLDALRGTPLVRNFAEASSALLYIFALAIAPLVLASALLQATPLLVTAGAALFLGETVGWRRWLSILAGFVGVLIILDPWTQGFHIAGLAMLACVVMLALRDLVTRRMPQRFGTMSVSAWGFSSMAPAGALLMWLQGDAFVWLELGQWLALGSAIFTGVIAYYAVVAAMRIGEVSAIAPFRYTRLVFASVLSISILGEALTPNIVIGAGIVVGSGLYMLMRERAKTAAAPRPREA